MARDPYRYFRVEARELVASLGQGLLDLEKGAGEERLAAMLRAAHTLKGAARVVRQPEIAERTHAVEDLLSPHRDGSPVPRERIDQLFALLDQIEERIRALDAAPSGDAPAAPSTSNASVPTATELASPVVAPPPPPEPPRPAASSPRDLGRTPSVVPAAPTAAENVASAAREDARLAADEPLRTVSADLAEMESLVDGIAQVFVPMRQARDHLATSQRAADTAGLLVQQLVRARNVREGANARAIAVAEELRSTCEALVRGMTQSLEQMERELGVVHESAEQLRLVPVASIFTVLERTARDAGRAAGKKVVFAASGGDVRLDAHVLASLRAALVQAVRNAVAHGIEAEGDRVARGKSAEGRIVVDVLRRGRRVVVRVRDDGRGVDVAKVRRAAVAGGMATDEVAAMSDDAVRALLLERRLSTSEGVTELAGRGVGLDVVRDAAARLGGTATLSSTAGEGTTLELAVPLVIAAVEALLVEGAGVTATFPLESVRATVRLEPGQLTTGPHGSTVVHRGSVLPYVGLDRLFGRNTARKDGTGVVVVVEGRGGAAAAVGVDRLLGTSNVVVRPLPELTPVKAVIAGASVNATGTPEPMLDPDEVVASAQGAMPVDVVVAGRRLPLLVIDDSLTTRMLEQSILESAGFEVDVATSAEEGMAMAREKRYGVFVVDVEMPGMDGFEFVATTRRDPELGQVPAILVTSRDAPEDLKRGEDAGAIGYIVKGEFDQQRLLDLIAAAGVSR